MRPREMSAEWMLTMLNQTMNMMAVNALMDFSA